MGQFLENHQPPKPIQSKAGNWNSPITIKETECIVQNLLQRNHQPGVEVHTCNPCTWERDAEGS
jgi:sulfur relay (sulfurtransferase) complex TusBCD TusD component (DsrE family)